MRTHEEFCTEIFERKKAIIKKRREQKRMLFACSSFAFVAAIVISAKAAFTNPRVEGEEHMSLNSPIVDLTEGGESNANHPSQIENSTRYNECESEKIIEEEKQINDNYQSNASVDDDESEEEIDRTHGEPSAEHRPQGREVNDSLYSTSHPMLEAGEDPYPWGGNKEYPAAPPILDAEDDPYPHCSE